MDNAAAAAAADDGVVVAPGDPFKTKAAELAAAFDAETEVLVQGHIEGWTAQCENEADEMLGVTKQHRRRLYGEAARYVQMLSMVRGQRNLDFKPSQYTVPLEAARLDLLFKEAIQYTQSRKWGRTTAHIPPPTVVLMLLVMIGKARFHNNPLLPTPDYSAFMLKISRTPEYPLLLDLFGGKAKNFQTYVSSAVALRFLFFFSLHFVNSVMSVTGFLTMSAVADLRRRQDAAVDATVKKVAGGDNVRTNQLKIRANRLLEAAARDNADAAEAAERAAADAAEEARLAAVKKKEEEEALAALAAKRRKAQAEKLAAQKREQRAQEEKAKTIKNQEMLLTHAKPTVLHERFWKHCLTNYFKFEVAGKTVEWDSQMLTELYATVMKPVVATEETVPPLNDFLTTAVLLRCNFTWDHLAPTAMLWYGVVYDETTLRRKVNSVLRWQWDRCYARQSPESPASRYKYPDARSPRCYMSVDCTPLPTRGGNELLNGKYHIKCWKFEVWHDNRGVPIAWFGPFLPKDHDSPLFGRERVNVATAAPEPVIAHYEGEGINTDKGYGGCCHCVCGWKSDTEAVSAADRKLFDDWAVPLRTVQEHFFARLDSWQWMTFNRHEAGFAMLAFNFIMLWQWYIETKFVPNGCRYAQADPRLPKWPASNEDLAAMGMPCQCGMAKDSEAGVRSLETAKAIRQHMLERFKAAGAAPPKKKESKSGKRARPDE